MIRIFATAILFVLSLQLSAQSIYLRPVQKNSSIKGPFNAASISRPGDVLALSGTDKTIHIVDATTLNEKAVIQTGTMKASGIAFSRDGRNIIAGLPDGTIAIWETTRGTALRNFTHEASIRSVDVDQSGRVISGGVDRTVKVWDMATGTPMGQFPTQRSEITALAYSPDGKIAVAAGYGGSLTMFNAGTFTEFRTITQSRSYATLLTFSPDGKYFAAAHVDSTVSIWNGRNGEAIATLRSPGGSVTSIAFHPNSKYLISVGTAVSFWDIASQKVFYTMSEESFVPHFAVVAQQQDRLAVISRSGEIRTYTMFEKKPDQNGPSITLLSPRVPAAEPLKIFSSEVEFAGMISDESAIKEVTINGTAVPTQPATADERGSMNSSHSAVTFTSAQPLSAAGVNTFTISATDVEENTSTQTVSVTKLMKDASVELVNPTESIETDQISIDLQFKAWLDFTTYAVLLNNIEIVKKENFPKKPIGTLRTEKLSLSAGLNQIQLTVNGRNGERIRKTINITRRMLGAPTSIADENRPIRNTSGQPQRWAVVVGVSEYGNPAIKNLAYADRDAKAFAEFLKSSAGGGFEEERVKILLNKDATLQNIKTALFNFLRQTVDKDLVVIYFAGHGAPEPANPNNNYLLCYDTDPNALETSAFPMWDVNTALQRYIPSKRVVVFTDACHSGGISSDIATRGMSTTDDNMINQYLADLSKTKEGIIVFTASQAGEVSQELEKFGHGVFTYYLLEGMKGEADFNNDYTVTIGELMDYVEEKVKRQTSGNQHPTRNQGAYDKDLTISLIPN
ncbi:MAG: caspase family protein [Bacteroidota bacterium]